jgi:hypothetical protein
MGKTFLDFCLDKSGWDADKVTVAALKKFAKHGDCNEAFAQLSKTKYLQLGRFGNVAYADLMTSVEPFRGLDGIEDVDLFGHQIVDISGLASLRNLRVVHLSQNRISKLPDLSNWAKVRFLVPLEPPRKGIHKTRSDFHDQNPRRGAFKR